jgi:serine/threonine protein kinase
VTHFCPACQRKFDEPGFCPFDRTQLAEATGADKPTVFSAAIAIPEDPTRHATDVDPHRTFPMTPSGVRPAVLSPADSLDLTNQRPRPAPPPPAVPPVRAVSASENPAEALEAYRNKYNEYDRLIGQILDDDYIVERKIGEGGMGVVFAARHAVLERPLAIKVLKREVMRDIATIRRFEREARAASRIGHPNIIELTDFRTTHDGLSFSVMEYVDGVTLGAAIRADAPFDPPRTLRIAAQIARALGAAHDKGIVHRDLKPENVFLVDRDGRPDFVKIVDFGIAKVAPAPGSANEPRLTRAGSVFGTPEYMAPEQAAGRGDTDGRVDIYALGVIVYEMICGRVPHRADSMVRTLAMQMLDPVEPPTKVRPDLNIPPALEGVVMKALAKKREERYQTMGEMLVALERVAKQVLPSPIGQSVTGSPVYGQMPPVPPGADPALSDPSIVISPPSAVTLTPPVPGTRRLKNEPQFVTGGSAVPLDPVITDDIEVGGRSRWPLILLAALIAGGAAAAVVIVVAMHGSEERRDDHHEPIALHTPDAAVVVEVPVDAAALEDAAMVDADVVVVVPNDAGRPPRPTPHADAGVTVASTPNHRGTYAVQIITKPEGATLYVGATYRGVGGTSIEEPAGTKLDVTCKYPNHKPGTVRIVFDGKNELALCETKRIKLCVDNIKNPFDDCELDPNLRSPTDPNAP